MLLGLREQISSWSCFGRDIKLLMSGALKIMLHPDRWMPRQRYRVLHFVHAAPFGVRWLVCPNEYAVCAIFRFS